MFCLNDHAVKFPRKLNRFLRKREIFKKNFTNTVLTLHKNCEPANRPEDSPKWYFQLIEARI